MLPTRCSAASVEAPTCRVPTKFGSRSSGWSDGVRLRLEHVASRSGEPAGAERFAERRLVDDAAARRVDQQRMGAAQSEFRGYRSSPRVCGVYGTLTLMTSDVGMSEARAPWRAMPACAKTSSGTNGS